MKLLIFFISFKRNNVKSERHIITKSPARLPMFINTIDDVYLLLNASQKHQRMPKGQLTINIDRLDENERLRYGHKLNKFAHSCGCMEGGVFALIALMIAVAYTLFKILNGAWLELIPIILGSLVLIPICALAGKIVGQLFARLRFRRTCISLIQSLTHQKSLPMDTGKDFQ